MPMKVIYFFSFLLIAFSNAQEVQERFPVFPGCESLSAEETLSCFKAKIDEHVSSNFIYPEEALKKNIEGKVYVDYTIDENGIVSVNNVNGPDTIINEEAKRIILLLPEMQPSLKKGKPNKIRLLYPIVFKI